MLKDTERGLPRRTRRALLASRRGVVQKRVPFGRTAVIDFETGADTQDDRTIYMHQTKGLMDRRTTIPLLNNLIEVTS